MTYTQRLRESNLPANSASCELILQDLNRYPSFKMITMSYPQLPLEESIALFIVFVLEGLIVRNLPSQCRKLSCY